MVSWPQDVWFVRITWFCKPCKERGSIIFCHYCHCTWDLSHKQTQVYKMYIMHVFLLMCAPHPCAAHVPSSRTSWYMFDGAEYGHVGARSSSRTCIRSTNQARPTRARCGAQKLIICNICSTLAAHIQMHRILSASCALYCEARCITLRALQLGRHSAAGDL